MLRMTVDIWQKCVISPWLFKLYMDEILKEVTAQVTGNKVGLKHSGQKWNIKWHTSSVDYGFSHS